MYDGEFGRDYGACTYQQIVEQTPAGRAKFYSCFFYMVGRVIVGYKNV
jgi:hypothetical protein